MVFLRKVTYYLFKSYVIGFILTLLYHLGDKIISAHGEQKYEVAEVGIMHPEQLPTGYL